MPSVPQPIQTAFPFFGRRCTHCGIDKPLEAFSIRDRATGALSSWCKPCQNERRMAKYRQQAAGTWVPYSTPPPPTERVCKVCGTLKNAAAFRPLRRMCRACEVVAHRANSARNRQCQRRYRIRHADDLRARRRARYYTDPRRYGAERARQARAANAQPYRDAVRRYKAAHPDTNRVMCSRRRARLFDAPGRHTVAEWRALKLRYDYRCLCCGRREPDIKLTFDHVLPLSLGGSDGIENGQPLCGPCNSSKSNKHIDYRR